MEEEEELIWHLDTHASVTQMTPLLTLMKETHLRRVSSYPMGVGEGLVPVRPSRHL